MADTDGVEQHCSRTPWRAAPGSLSDLQARRRSAAAATERATALDQLDGAFAALNSRGALHSVQAAPVLALPGAGTNAPAPLGLGCATHAALTCTACPKGFSRTGTQHFVRLEICELAVLQARQGECRVPTHKLLNQTVGQSDSASSVLRSVTGRPVCVSFSQARPRSGTARNGCWRWRLGGAPCSRPRWLRRRRSGRC